MTTELDEPSSRQQRAIALEKLDNAVCTALAGIDEDEARRSLQEALEACSTVVPPQVMGCVEAAGEHLRYGERMEARMLLTLAHRLLSRVSRPMAVPAPSTPGDVGISVRGEVDRVERRVRG
ncbi:hypothetical protein SAMN04488074_102319 [Lentzea albidocapillata subsp. violacea]|uniref:Uncharacterized protein n=1 Tax=Lentzea albidocapillata subsp. violacea TaxID=128104 RepID=A0A1G8UK31_9PSEU|nr:hypothetical protein [Lentzea albidocapillata]SDJ53837.1 hypothetical protein SAMN04488074_102319 [Lentzea albidocapillata subsp. violacea]